MSTKDMIWVAVIALAVIYISYHVSFLKSIFYA